MQPRFIYRNRSVERFYDAETEEMRGGPDKVIVYLNGVLCAMDHESKIAIRVSRWKLLEIGLACCFAALKGSRATAQSDEPLPLSAPEFPAGKDPGARADESLDPPPATKPRREDQWDRLMRELRDLSR
jgi:type IV secretory pathway TrbD component